MKFQVFFLKNNKRKLITFLILIILFCFFVTSIPVNAGLFGEKIKKISDNELKEVIKVELNLSRDPNFYPYTDSILKEALDREINSQETLGLTFGSFILDALYEEKLVEMCYPNFDDKKSSEFFSKLADNLSDWQNNFASKITKLAILGAVQALGMPTLGIGISTLFLAIDLSEINISIVELEKAACNYKLFLYLNDRYVGNSHETAFAEMDLPLLWSDKKKQATENYFLSLWGKYGYAILSNDLAGFKEEQHEMLRELILQALNRPPNPPTSMIQFKSDGKTILKIGKTTSEQTVILKAKISDPDGNKVRLQIELRRLDEYGGQFDEDKGGLQQSDLFENNSEIMIPIYGVADGDYHWRVRAIDEHGLVGEWISFGGNPDSAVDFTVGQEVVAPIITSPLKITPDPPYYVGDTISAEFTITNQSSLPIKFSVLTVGGRDPDNHVADFTLRQNITLEPSRSYNYQGTLTLNKVGDHHFFCTYQTPDGNWNTNVDLGSGLTDEDRTEDISVEEKEKPSIVPDILEGIILEWDKTFGGSEDDCAKAIIQTTDGGYAVAGSTSSKGAGKGAAWVIKLDEQGNRTWDRTYGGSGYDQVSSLIQTNDGGYAVAGSTSSKGAGKGDVWVIKLDGEGNKVWDRTYGGSSYDGASSLIQTTDGSYAVAGRTESKGAGNGDAWVIKLDVEGNKVWDRTYGGSGGDGASSLIQTTDGSYAVAGVTFSNSTGSWDAWVIKLDGEGNKVWDRTYGGSGIDWAFSLIQTTDGSYAVAGRTESKGAGGVDFWVIKLDGEGNKVWDRTYGGSGPDGADSLIQTTDGGYAVAGITVSKDVGKEDFWVIKLDKQGNKIWDRTFGGSNTDWACSLIQTNDGSYVIAGSTYSKGAGKEDAWVIKLSSKSIEALEEEVTAMETLEDKIEKEKILIDSSLYHFEYSVPRPWGKRARLPVSVSGPADELALILTNPKGETDIKFISKRALIDNFETIYLMMGRESLSEGYYTLTVKTVTPEKVIYKKETLFTSPKNVQITGGEITIKRGRSDSYTIPKEFNIYFKSDGDLPFFFDEIEIIFTLPGRQIFGKLEEEYKIFSSLKSVPSGEIKYIESSSQWFYYHGSSDKIKATVRVYKKGKVFLTFPMKLTIEK